ncbi:hypothetical protein [Paucilactobacillus wasatchensis]|uniref:Uncharacterized protein n=1 Tax=Paucilactobacillus wasatchensis TaxID=1335616 RepID=A0A0D1A511_9LACO|nr:hypothetical protein WDC_1470 [Paucilactobacillus wasatchensis]
MNARPTLSGGIPPRMWGVIPTGVLARAWWEGIPHACGGDPNGQVEGGG